MALPFLAVAWALDRRYGLLFVLVSASLLLNLALHDPLLVGNWAAGPDPDQPLPGWVVAGQVVNVVHEPAGVRHRAGGDARPGSGARSHATTPRIDLGRAESDGKSGSRSLVRRAAVGAAGSSSRCWRPCPGSGASTWRRCATTTSTSSRARATSWSAGLTLTGPLTSWGVPDPPGSVYLMLPAALAPSPPTAAVIWVGLLNVAAVVLTYLLAERFHGRARGVRGRAAVRRQPVGRLLQPPLLGRDRAAVHGPRALGRLRGGGGAAGALGRGRSSWRWPPRSRSGSWR